MNDILLLDLANEILHGCVCAILVSLNNGTWSAILLALAKCREFTVALNKLVHTSTSDDQ